MVEQERGKDARDFETGKMVCAMDAHLRKGGDCLPRAVQLNVDGMR